METVVYQARNHGFGEGWLPSLHAMGVVQDSPLRNPEQIPYPAPTPPVQSQVDATDEEETFSMRELVHAIDTHVETVDLKVTNNLHAAKDGQGHTLAADQPTRNAPTNKVIQLLPNDPLCLILMFQFSFIFCLCLIKVFYFYLLSLPIVAGLW